MAFPIQLSGLARRGPAPAQLGKQPTHVSIITKPNAIITQQRPGARLQHRGPAHAQPCDPSHYSLVSRAIESPSSWSDQSIEVLTIAVARCLATTALVASIICQTLLSTASSATAFSAAYGQSTAQPSLLAASPHQLVSAPRHPAPPTAAPSTSAPAQLQLPCSLGVQLGTIEQFDNFVMAANRAGVMVVVLFHASWCSASKRTAVELERMRAMFEGRSVIFAHVDCPPPGGKAGSGAAEACPLAKALAAVHRITRTPTTRMYCNNACVDEVVGFRPVELRQTTADLLFKYAL